MAEKTFNMRVCVFCSTQLGNGNSAKDAAVELAQLMHANKITLIYGGGTSGLMGALAKERVRLGGPESVVGVIPYGLIEQERDNNSNSIGKKAFEHKETKEAGKLGKLKQFLSTPDGTKSTGTPESSSTCRLAPNWTDTVDLPTDLVYGQVVGVPSLARRKLLMMNFVKNGGPGSGFVALPGGFGSMDEVLEVLTHRQLNEHAQPMVLCNVDGFWDGFAAWMENACQKGFLGQESRAFVEIVEGPQHAIHNLLAQRAKAAWRLPPDVKTGSLS